jgi:hypothetical protein
MIKLDLQVLNVEQRQVRGCRVRESIQESAILNQANPGGTAFLICPDQEFLRRTLA